MKRSIRSCIVLILISAYTIEGEEVDIQRHERSRLHKRRAPLFNPGQPAPNIIGFHAYLDSSLSLGNQQIIRFDRVTTNEGNAYDASNGIFTCIKAGVYYFHYNVMFYSSHKGLVCITIDGNCVGAASYGTNPQNYESAANALVKRLEVGQQVWLENYVADGYIYSYYSSSYSGSAGTTFSGLRIAA